MSSALFYNHQSIHDETVTTNREIVANHLAYAHLYMFLVAGLYMNEDISQVVILDISGVYVQIYDQGYYNKLAIANLKQEYSDAHLWRVVVIGE